MGLALLDKMSIDVNDLLRRLFCCSDKQSKDLYEKDYLKRFYEFEERTRPAAKGFRNQKVGTLDTKMNPGTEWSLIQRCRTS